MVLRPDPVILGGCFHQRDQRITSIRGHIVAFQNRSGQWPPIGQIDPRHVLIEARNAMTGSRQPETQFRS